MDSLVYALIQVIHNIGAVAIVGLSIYGLWTSRQAVELQRRVLILIGTAWLIQALSGPAFGIATYSFYGNWPDIHAIAIGALIIKIICLLLGLFLVVMLVVKRDRGNRHAIPVAVFAGQSALGIIALSAAAFLRWYS
jgi:hypothetical protein